VESSDEIGTLARLQPDDHGDRQDLKEEISRSGRLIVSVKDA